MIDMERRDRALDFRWGIPAEFLWAAGIPDTPDRLYDQARRSIYAAACIAADGRGRVVDQLQPAKGVLRGRAEVPGPAVHV